jgi:hypothetical protein
VLRETTVTGALTLADVVIDDSLDLVRARIGILKLMAQSGEHPTIRAFDLRGFQFGELDADWRYILAGMEPLDRAVCLAIVESRRKQGLEREAGLAYLAMKRKEAGLAWGRLWRKGADETLSLWDALLALPDVVWHGVQRWAWRYGVRPFRLLVLSLLFLASGSWVFQQPGAVEPRERPSSGTTTLAAARLGLAEAAGMSLRLFVPVVEVPIGTRWVPANQRIQGLGLSSAWYAAIHRLAGAALVPLGLASLGGLLIRKT